VSAAASIEMDKFADINETELKEILENRNSPTTKQKILTNGQKYYLLDFY
jgi:hypothetical protein